MAIEKAKPFQKTLKQIEAVKVMIQSALFICLFGGSRSGKTAIIIYAIITRAIKVPSRHLILRRSFNHAKTSIWLDTLPKIFKLAYPKVWERVTPNKSDFFLPLSNGSEIWIAGLDDGDRIEKILGNEYSSIHLNEISQIDYNSFNLVLSRLAEKNSLEKKMYFDMNPPSKKHWSYKMFIEHKNPLDKKPLDPNNYLSLLMNPEDNIDNIDKNYMKILNEMPEKYQKRFMKGQFSDDDDGLLFKESHLQRIWALPEFDRIVIALDPAVTSNENSNETGITVVGKKGNFGYLLEDKSDIYTPSEWANVAVDLFKKWGADKVIGEVNNGGDLIEATLRNVAPHIPYKSVRATRGKTKRAEPVAALYETHKIFHYGVHEELEDQMWEFETVQSDSTISPDRVDAMVWGFTELFELNHLGSIFDAL